MVDMGIVMGLTGTVTNLTGTATNLTDTVTSLAITKIHTDIVTNKIKHMEQFLKRKSTVIATVMEKTSM